MLLAIGLAMEAIPGEEAGYLVSVTEQACMYYRALCPHVGMHMHRPIPPNSIMWILNQGVAMELREIRAHSLADVANVTAGVCRQRGFVRAARLSLAAGENPKP